MTKSVSKYLFQIYFKDRTSLRNLHGNLTENGDSNSQYEIARQILENDAGKCLKLYMRWF